MSQNLISFVQQIELALGYHCRGTITMKQVANDHQERQKYC